MFEIIIRKYGDNLNCGGISATPSIIIFKLVVVTFYKGLKVFKVTFLEKAIFIVRKYSTGNYWKLKIHQWKSSTQWWPAQMTGWGLSQNKWA